MEIVAPRAEPSGAVLVIHSWWGLTDSFRDYGDRLVRAGYLVGLADLFAGHTATSETDARRLRAMPRRVPIYRRLGRDIDDLRHRADGRRLGVVGFSMGGHWAVWLSQREIYDVSAAILYYAARGGDYSRCRTGIQAHFADRDAWVSAGARATMERAIGRAGCRYRSFDYPGTQHWFAEASRRGNFDPAAAELACRRDLVHLKACLAGGRSRDSTQSSR